MGDTTTSTLDPQKLQQVIDWIETMRAHWLRCQGNIHGDKMFWQECLHGAPQEAWMAWAHCHDAIMHQDVRFNQKYPYLDQDIWTVIDRLAKGEPITRPWNRAGAHVVKAYNRPVFRAAMAIKDIIADITGRPFESAPAQGRKPTKASLQQHFDKIQAEFEVMQAKIDELFD